MIRGARGIVAAAGLLGAAQLFSHLVPAAAEPHEPRAKPPVFSRLVVDGTTRRNGRKPKVIIDPDGNGAVAGAQDGPLGFALYRPGKPPSIVNPYSGGAGSEDAQAAALGGDRWPDIVVGGLNNITYILRNPRNSGCADVYRCRWKRSVIDTAHSSHDVVTGDIDHDGAIDVATESGVYFNDPRTHRWSFTGRNVIARDGEGTSLADLAGDGVLDVIAPYRSGTVLARFINPLHHGGNPRREVWRVQAIDAHPLFTGNMTTAVADINGDGRNDILLAPMYGRGGLVWYEAPPGNGGVWKRHPIDPTINFVHQGSLQIADFNGDCAPDIAFAEQDQSPTRRVGVYYNADGTGRRWRLQILSTNGGHNIKAGVLGPDRRPSILTARHGYFGGANPLVVWSANANRRPRSTCGSSHP